MRPQKTKRTARLYFQFSPLLTAPRLSADEVGCALIEAGLIEPVAYDKRGTLSHYRETQVLLTLEASAFREAVTKALTEYCRKNNIPCSVPANPANSAKGKAEQTEEERVWNS